jgi:hypothetical protein
MAPGTWSAVFASKTSTRSPLASAAALSSCNASAEKGVSGFTNTAMAGLPGMHSRRISSRLPTTSLASLLTPVTFAPGRFRLATTPAPIGSPTLVKTTGIVVVAAFRLRGQRPESGNQHVRACSNQFRGQLRQSLGLSIGGAVIEVQIPARRCSPVHSAVAAPSLNPGPGDRRDSRS